VTLIITFYDVLLMYITKFYVYTLK